MATLVCFHAHPDDECIATGGVMAKAADAGHRVVLVVATKGEHGEVEEGFLGDDETLEQCRVDETHKAAAELGVQRVEFLGYVDSGMMGTPENDRPEAFWQADVEEAAERLAAILREEDADVLTHYDDHGNYGHPDHIQVHRVGMRAGELAGTPLVYQATMNRDHLRKVISARLAAANPDEIPGDVTEIGDAFGSPGDLITTAVDIRWWLDRKKTAMRAHASQITEASFFLTMPDDAFAEGFGTEWFIREGAGRGGEPYETDLQGLG
jgi:LmbE family N-acetylglucosaminyl deacetylase